MSDADCEGCRLFQPRSATPSSERIVLMVSIKLCGCGEDMAGGKHRPVKSAKTAKKDSDTIDVVRTCKNVGLPPHLSSDMRIRWTGLVLLH